MEKLSNFISDCLKNRFVIFSFSLDERSLIGTFSEDQTDYLNIIKILEYHFLKNEKDRNLQIEFKDSVLKVKF